ncbi:hypothetical protein WMY93_030690 [Mugilogobius chulae]|uniref:Uncharacterized protein n=1 Tax=Mugilogobius chulae TaxID=88201 RepID=A0AAW0MSZ4_9GOBI
MSPDLPESEPNLTESEPNLPESEPKYLLWLWLLLLIPVVTVMTSVLLVRICRKKRAQNDDETDIIASTTDTEYENTGPVPKRKDALAPCPPRGS